MSDEEEKVKTKKVNKKIIIILVLLFVLISIILIAIFAVKNRTLTIDKIVNELKENSKISKYFEVSRKNADWENPFEKENINIERIVFYDTRINDYEDNYCAIYILPNEDYAKLLESYFKGIIKGQEEIIKEYNANLVSPIEEPTIYQKKNCIIFMNGELDEKYINIYINQVEETINKCIFLKEEKLSDDRYHELSDIIEEKIDVLMKSYTDNIESLFDEWIKIIEEYIVEAESNSDISKVKEIRELIDEYNIEEIEYFNEKIVDWNTRLNNIEIAADNKAKQEKESKANDITTRLNSVSESLNNEELTTIEKEISKLTDSYYETYKTDWNNKIEEIKNKIATKEVDDYKTTCQTYTYDQISRNPETYKGQKVHFTGEVIQVLEYSTSVELRVNITKDKYGYYDDTVYIIYNNLDMNNRILEGDIIDIYGELDGLESYVSTLGATITIPRVIAKYITVQ